MVQNSAFLALLTVFLLVGWFAGEVRFLVQLEPKDQWEAQNAILRRHVPAALADLA